MAGTSGRPLPPRRPRPSQSRSVSSSLQSKSANQSARDDESEDGTQSIKEAEEQVAMGGLELDTNEGVSYEIPLEEVEDALRGLSRDDMVLALKRAKEQMDILDAKLEAHVERNEVLTASLSDYATQLDALEADKAGLQFALTHREERIDELLRDQERMEEDVYRKGQVNERLRKQLDESEKSRVEAEKRYEDQTASSDKERQYYVDMEKLLRSQKTKASAALERAQSANHELVKQKERLQSKVSQQARYSGLRIASPSGRSLSGSNLKDSTDASIGSGEEDNENGAALGSSGSDATLRKVDLGGSNENVDEVAALQAELETIQASHTSMTATMQQLQAELRELKTANMELRSQNETFVELLQEKTISGELVTESAMLNRRYSTLERGSGASSEAGETDTTDADDDDDDEDGDDVPDVPTKKSRGKTVKSKRNRSDSHDPQSNPPHDLASELQTSEPEQHTREVRKRDRTRDRSDALSGNVEELHREIWELRDANQALTLYVNKIVDRIIAREGYENVLAVDADQKRTLRAKPAVIGGSTSGSPEMEKPSESPAKLTTAAAQPSQQAITDGPTTPNANLGVGALQSKLARRTTSIDWRSFLPNVGGSSAGGRPSNNDRVIHEARKIRSSEEIEDKDDEEVRKQIRQNLLDQGIVLPNNQLKAQKRSSTLGTFFSRVMGAAPTATAETPQKSLDASHRYQSQSDISIDGVTTPSTSHIQTSSENGSSTTSDGSASPVSRREMRQRALEMNSGGATNLTEAPQRRSLVEDLRARRSEMSADSRSISSRASADPSSSPNVSPSLGVLAPMPEEEVEEQDQSVGWRKALRRVSLLGSAPATPPLSNSKLTIEESKDDPPNP